MRCRRDRFQSLSIEPKLHSLPMVASKQASKQTKDLKKQKRNPLKSKSNGDVVCGNHSQEEELSHGGCERWIPPGRIEDPTQHIKSKLRCDKEGPVISKGR